VFDPAFLQATDVGGSLMWICAACEEARTKKKKKKQKKKKKKKKKTCLGRLGREMIARAFRIETGEPHGDMRAF